MRGFGRLLKLGRGRVAGLWPRVRWFGAFYALYGATGRSKLTG